MWANVPGLRSKWFWFDSRRARAGAIYTFINKQAWEAYKNSGLYQGVYWNPDDETFVSHENSVPVIEVHENLAGGELTTEMGNWPVSGRNP